MIDMSQKAMNITISNPDAQWLAVACARAQAVFPGGSKEAQIFERSLQGIINALERSKKSRKNEKEAERKN